VGARVDLRHRPRHDPPRCGDGRARYVDLERGRRNGELAELTKRDQDQRERPVVLMIKKQELWDEVITDW
jgi:hypothetical protein